MNVFELNIFEQFEFCTLNLESMHKLKQSFSPIIKLISLSAYNTPTCNRMLAISMKKYRQTVNLVLCGDHMKV